MFQSSRRILIAATSLILILSLLPTTESIKCYVCLPDDSGLPCATQTTEECGVFTNKCFMAKKGKNPVRDCFSILTYQGKCTGDKDSVLQDCYTCERSLCNGTYKMSNKMGTTSSSLQSEEQQDYWWNSSASEEVNNCERADFDDDDRAKRQKRMKEELDEFKLELARKHEKRRQLIAEKQREMQELRDEVRRLEKENAELKLKSNAKDFEEVRKENLELKKDIAKMQKDLQVLNAEIVSFESERQDYKAHVVALKDVISVSKQMLVIREAQLKELREKVQEIEVSLAGREFNALSQDLRNEYEKQLSNIRNLRIYYEERQRADKREKDDLRRVLDEVKKELQEERDKNKELADNVKRLEEENSNKYDEIKNLESSIGLTKAESRQYQSELAVINQMFSQILLGFNNTQEIDIDKLIKVLEENHDILQNIAINEESNQVSALPKVLLDLVYEINDQDKDSEESNQNQEDIKESSSSVLHHLNSASEIAENLPKVWKVLIELLSHQSIPPCATEDNSNACYKVVETPKGPHLALSVSKTFIRLKDLILEKKSLERETGRLKHLNTHLESRLQDQEKRLQLVTHELSETWHVVGKLQKKHQLLHTQEKILRYELAEKRKLLNELKLELEYSREKWSEAREKNANTEKQWELLRSEFASRKTGTGDDYNNSVESGYSDDKECSSEDEPGYETDISECNQKICETDDQSQEDLTADTDTIAIVAVDVESNSEKEALMGEASRILPEEIKDFRAAQIKDGEAEASILNEKEDRGMIGISVTEIGEAGSTNIADGEDTRSASEESQVAAINNEKEVTGRLEDTKDHVLMGPLATENDKAESTNVATDEATRSPSEERNDCRVVAINNKEAEATGTPENIEYHGMIGISDTENEETGSTNIVDGEATKRLSEEMAKSEVTETDKTSTRSLEEILAAREERLQRLEGQCGSLVQQVSNTSTRGEAIANKLDALHEIYGEGRSQDDGSSTSLEDDKQESD